MNKLDSAWHWVESINPTLSQDQITQSHQTISNIIKLYQTGIWFTLIHTFSFLVSPCFTLADFTVSLFSGLSSQWWCNCSRAKSQFHLTGAAEAASQVVGKRIRHCQLWIPSHAISAQESWGTFPNLSKSFRLFWNFLDYFDFCSSVIAHDSKKTKSTLFQEYFLWHLRASEARIACSKNHITLVQIAFCRSFDSIHFDTLKDGRT